MAASKLPNSVSTTGVVTAGVVLTVLRAPVSTTGVVTAVPVSTVLSAPVPMLLTFCIASRVACVLASTPVSVTPFPASEVTLLLLTLANCKPLVSAPAPVVVDVVSVPTVLRAPVAPVVSVDAIVLVRLDTEVAPAVTTSEFCNAVTALLAAAVLEPVALANVAAAAVTLPVVVSVAAAAPSAASPVCAVTVVPTTEPRTIAPTLSVLPVMAALVTTVAALLTTFCKNGSSTTPDNALSTSLFIIDEAPPVN